LVGWYHSRRWQLAAAAAGRPTNSSALRPAALRAGRFIKYAKRSDRRTLIDRYW